MPAPVSGATLRNAVQTLKDQLGRLGIFAKPIQQVRVSGPGVTGVRTITSEAAGAPQLFTNLSPEMKGILASSVPGAVFTGAVTLAGGGSPVDALKTSALDMALSAGGMSLAGKFMPGRLGTLVGKDKTGRTISTPHYETSIAQNIAGGLGSLGAMMLTPPGATTQQAPTIEQQEIQRALLNDQQLDTTLPGTNFQIQGLPMRVLNPSSQPLQYNQSLDQFGLMQMGAQ